MDSKAFTLSNIYRYIEIYIYFFFETFCKVKHRGNPSFILPSKYKIIIIIIKLQPFLSTLTFLILASKNWLHFRNYSLFRKLNSYLRNFIWKHFQRSMAIPHGNRSFWTRKQFKEIPTPNSYFYLSSASDMLPQDNFSFWIYFQLASQTQDGQSAKKE